MIHKKAPAKVVKRHCLFVDIFWGVLRSLKFCTFLTYTNYVFKIQIDSAPLPIFQNTNHFKYKYSAPLPMLRSKNYLFKCVLRLLVLLPLRSNKFLTAICWDFSSTSSLKCWIHLRVECIGNQSNCFTNLRKWNDSAVF